MTPTITFLEFCFRRLVGPPASSRKYFRCPWCVHRNPSVVINEPLGNNAIKFRCHRCLTWGDEFDLVWQFHPTSRYGQRLTIVLDLRAEYEKWVAEGCPSGGVPFSPTGMQGAHIPVEGRRHTARVIHAWEILIRMYREAGISDDDAYHSFIEDVEAGYYCELHPLPDEVVAYWTACREEAVKKERQEREFRESMAKIDAAHMAQCEDPECEWRVCRAQRGLPPISPLTREERLLKWEEDERKRVEAKREWDEAVRRMCDMLDNIRQKQVNGRAKR
jgi:hypothetical protein